MTGAPGQPSAGLDGLAIGLNRWDWRTPASFAVQVARAEDLGLDHAFLPVNPLAVPDPYVLMAAGGAATSTMKFGPLLETPVLRPPAVAAGSIATLSNAIDGRAMFTYGIGDTAVRFLGRRPSTVAELEMATSQLRMLLAGDRIDVDASAPAFLRHPPQHRVPVWVAAGGPRSLRAAGRSADGVFLRVGTHPANVESAVAAVRAGAAEVGRAPDEVALGLIVHTVFGAAPAAQASIARAMAAGFYEYSPALFEVPGFEWNGSPVEELQALVTPDFHHAQDLVAAGEVVSFLSDEVARSFCFQGDGPEIREQLTQIRAAVPEISLVVPHPVPLPVGETHAQYLEFLAALR